MLVQSKILLWTAPWVHSPNRWQVRQPARFPRPPSSVESVGIPGFKRRESGDACASGIRPWEAQRSEESVRTLESSRINLIPSHPDTLAENIEGALPAEAPIPRGWVRSDRSTDPKIMP